MTRYFRYTEEDYLSGGMYCSYVIGYGHNPSNNPRFDSDEIPNLEMFRAMKKENPKGDIAHCLHEWCEEFGIDYDEWLDSRGEQID